MANKNFIVKNGVTLEGYGEVIDSAGNWTGAPIGTTFNVISRTTTLAISVVNNSFTVTTRTGSVSIGVS